jgi:regulator of sigma E protease
LDIFALLPAFGGLIWTVVAFVIALSVIVAIHEYGHYIVGRWSGIHADVFSLGFGPVLWSRMDKRGTRWQIALLPFGGYVKFMGDANAASAPDGEAVAEMSEADRRKTMLGAPLWARAATVAAGPVFNFALSILIFAAIAMSQGTVRDPLSIGEVAALPVQHELLSGDEPVAIAGVPVPDYRSAEFDAFIKALPQESLLDWTVRRDGAEVTVQGPYPMPPLIHQLSPQSAAVAIEMKVGDVITAVDGTPIASFAELKAAVEGAEGRPLLLDVWRDGETLEFALVPKRVDEPQAGGGFKTSWRIGILGGLAFEPASELANPLDALRGGVMGTFEIMRGSVSGLWHMLTGAISSCNMSGPIGIAEVSGQMASQGATNFIYFIGVLSAAVGLLNLFPVPILDGGHLVFYAFEAVVGRAPNEQALRILMGMGLALILSMMGFALFNDIFCP